MALQPLKSPAREPLEDRSKNALEFIEWVASDDCRGLDDVGLVAEVSSRLARIGLPLDRLVLHFMTLHPDVIGRSVAWAPREPIEVYDSRNGNQLPAGRLRKALDGGELLMAAPDTRWEQLDIYLGRSLTQLVLAPLMSADGLLGVIVFGTTHAKGFDPAETATLERVVPSIRTAVELRLLKQTELGLLDAHVGAPTAARLLAKRSKHREAESLEGALLMFDFDRRSDVDASPQAFIDALERSRSVAIVSVKERGGEILDLSATRLLGVFPSGNPVDVSQRALVSAMDAVDTFATDNSLLEIAVSAHFGDLSYGSVGGSNACILVATGDDFDILDALSKVRRVRSDVTAVSGRIFELLGDKGPAATSELQVAEVDRISSHATLIG